MATDRSHEAANARETARLAALTGRSGADLSRDLGGGWNVSTALSHVAFWDRFAAERLKAWLRDGTVVGAGNAIDALNDALLHVWRALPTKAAAAEAVAAAEAIDRQIRDLTDEQIGRYRASLAPGQTPLFLDRTGHRREHCDQIEAALR